MDSKGVPPEELFEDGGDDSVEDRVARVQDFLYDLIAESETQFRLFLRASMEQWLQQEGRFDEPLRGARCLPMLELALQPCREQLDDETYEKLLYALATMVSLEPFIALMDVCQLDKERGKEVMNWAVRKLVRAVTES